MLNHDKVRKGVLQLALLKRLPNGYKPVILKLKQFLAKEVSEKIEALGDINYICQKLLSIGNVDNIGAYEDRGVMHVDFDIHFRNPSVDIGAFILVDPQHKSVKLGDTCTVFLNTYDSNDNENYIDNYKW